MVGLVRRHSPAVLEQGWNICDALLVVASSGRRPRPAKPKPYATCVRTQVAYNRPVKALFVELPPFERHRADYLDDEGFSGLQGELMTNPDAGDLMKGTGGLRKGALR